MNREKENSFLSSSKLPQRSTTNWPITNSNGVGYGNQKSTGALPPLKETNKFSSWADKSLFDQVDDILFD